MLHPCRRDDLYVVCFLIVSQKLYCSKYKGICCHSPLVVWNSRSANTNIREYLKKHENKLAVSEISKLEVLGYYKLTADEKTNFEHFFQNINILLINSEVIEKAITLRQTYKMSIGDSIIAATALLHNRKIFTNNEDDFTRIPGLKIISLKLI